MSPTKTKPTNRIIHGLLSGFVDLLYPPCCTICARGLTAGTEQKFCDDCLAKLEGLRSEQCPRCAAPLHALNLLFNGCPACHFEKYAFTQATAWGKYEGLLQDAILRMKHLHGESLGAHLAALCAEDLCEKLRPCQCDAVIPVPLHWTRRLWRGYNQAAVIAQAFASKLGKPYRSSWLWRHRQTPMQTGVSPEARRRNMRRAFRARIPTQKRNCTILLVDDVMTTGSTANACARALIAAGAGQVYLALLARAVG